MGHDERGMAMMSWSNGMGYGMGWGGWVLMALVMVAFWTLVVVAIVALFRTRIADGKPPYTADRESADTIIDKRFARGEIDAEQYRIAKEHLRAGR